METYEEKYKDLVKRLNKAREEKGVYTFNSVLDAVAPELKIDKSEDDRIRKELVEFIKSRGGFKGEWIAWLEKQGEHANFLSKIQVGDKVTRNEDGVLVNLSQLNRVAKKQGEQETLCDKCRKKQPSHSCQDITALGRCAVEHEQKPVPKFKIGDIITPKDGGHEPWQIIQVDMSDRKYRFKDGYVIHFSQEDDYELVEQQSALSEEDDAVLDALIRRLEGEDIYVSPHLAAEWLKSLKDKYTWKPSEEQMNALHYVTNFDYGGHKATLVSLYEQLKKLKNEK